MGRFTTNEINPGVTTITRDTALYAGSLPPNLKYCVLTCTGFWTNIDYSINAVTVDGSELYINTTAYNAHVTFTWVSIK